MFTQLVRGVMNDVYLTKASESADELIRLSSRDMKRSEHKSVKGKVSIHDVGF